MPELPDITVYVDALRRTVVGHSLRRVRLKSPFILRSVDPPLAAAEGKRVLDARRLGKRVVLVLEDDLFLVLHLMIAGRLRWKKPGGAPTGLATFEFDHGQLVLTEAGSKHRASLYVARGEEGLRALAPLGIEPLECDAATFAAALRSENHTLKRALTAPHIVSGIGNAYSDEILHRARLSPVLLTARMDDEQAARLHAACVEVLTEFTERLRKESKGKLPDKVTAFRPDFAVHGKFGESCPVCGTAVQRIVKGENESNYCPRCQTGGKMLADRALSRLLHDDWPRTIDEWEGRAMPRGKAGKPSHPHDP